MSFFDTAFDWLGNNADTLINVGTGIYDIYNQQQTRNQLQDAIQPGGIVDPFGAQRQQYQPLLSQLYSNPMSVQNTPGFQFAQQMGEQAVNRQASRSGHFHSPNRLQEIAKFNQGLATQTFNQERNALMQLAGAGINPNAGAYLQGMVGQQQLATGSGVSGGNVLGGGATGGGVFDLLSSFDDASGIADAASGGDGTTLSDQAMEAVSNYLSGPNEYAGTNLEAAGALGDGAVDRAQGLQDLGPNADLGGPSMGGYIPIDAGMGTFGQGANAVENIQQYNAPAGGLSAAGTGMASLGGALGSFALTKALGTEGNAAIATNALGGVGGSLAGGAIAGGMGATAGGAAGGAAAAGAMAGPMIPLAIAMMAYGGYSENQAISKASKEFAGQFAQHANIREGAAGPNGGAGKLITDPRSGSDYWIPQSTYDMWYGGDMDRTSYLYDPNNTGYMTGMMDWASGKIQSRDELREEDLGNFRSAHHGGGGLSSSQYQEMEDYYSNAWDTRGNPGRIATGAASGTHMTGFMDASTLTAPYTYVHNQSSGEGGNYDPGVWVNKQGNLANPTPTAWQNQDMREGHWTMGGQTFDIQTGTNLNTKSWSDVASKSCFIGETLVAMEGGGVKRIDEVKPGDRVIGGSSVNTVKSVERVALEDRYLYSINGRGKGWITDEHPIMTDRGWATFNNEHTYWYHGLDKNLVSTFQFFDMLHKLGGKVRLTSTEQHGAPADTAVYNLMLDGDHTYYAGPKVDSLYHVHNR